MDLAAVAVSALIFFVASAVQGFFGFGFGIIAMAGLTMSQDLIHAAGVVNVTGLVTGAWMAWRLREHISWDLVRRVLPSLFVGVAIGVTSLSALDRRMMVTALGVVIVLVAAWNLCDPKLSQRDSKPLDVGIGLVAGMLSGAFNTGGPPLVAHVYRRPDPPAVLRGTLQIIFLASGMCRLPVSAAQGLIDEAIALDSLLAVPFLAPGVLIGAALAHRVDPHRFRKACWIGLGTLGFALLIGG